MGTSADDEPVDGVYEVVFTVLFATSPEKIKLALCNPIFDLVVAHVKECFM